MDSAQGTSASHYIPEVLPRIQALRRLRRILPRCHTSTRPSQRKACAGTTRLSDQSPGRRPNSGSSRTAIGPGRTTAAERRSSTRQKVKPGTVEVDGSRQACVERRVRASSREARRPLPGSGCPVMLERTVRQGPVDGFHTVVDQRAQASCDVASSGQLSRADVKRSAVYAGSNGSRQEGIRDIIDIDPVDSAYTARRAPEPGRAAKTGSRRAPASAGRADRGRRP